MGKLTRMRMMRTGQIPELGAGEVAVLAMLMTITMERVRRTRREVRNGPGKGTEQSTGTGKGRGRGRGRETVKGKILFNKPQAEMISLVPVLCSCRKKYMRLTRAHRAN
jgi:hypothetical protein